MRAEDWDRRYAAVELVWSAGPNRLVADQTADLPPGRALDLACGEGRNALWLAGRGWRVVAADFSAVALGKGRRLAGAAPRGDAVTWVEADVTTWDPPGPFDLVVIAYLQLDADELAAALGPVLPAVAPGGTVLVVGHDRRNIAEGVGGPQDPTVLLDPATVTALLPGLVIERAETVERPVDGADRPALDTLVRAHRPVTPAS
ncbi:MAG TPA: class I SAM-dependent methyltransferase [Acidimicrobiales bacterium]|nr:class I SAM-dependent methyltransferase [Acidimicrobiales bacterium]